MDKKGATKTLARELTKAKGQTFVVNPAHQKQLLEEAIAYCPVKYEEPFPFKFKIGPVGTASKVVDSDEYQKFVKEYSAGVTDYCSKVGDANYVFTEPLESLGLTEHFTYLSLMNTFSFFALMGEEEEHDLVRMFYKDVPLEIVCAMDTLGIKHFADIYKVYCSDGFFDSLETLKVGKEFSDFVSKLRYDADDEVKVNTFDKFGGVDTLNVRLKKLGLSSSVSTTDRRKTDAGKYPNFVHRENLLDVVAQLRNCGIGAYTVHKGFFDFVFSLPYKEQNIKSNKEILQRFPVESGYIQVLTREYSQGKHFQEYFECLDSEKQARAVRHLKAVPERNPAGDSFLWSRGFKDIDLDYLKLYKEDAERFVDYFQSKKAEDKKAVLKDVMDCDFINEKVINWLNEHESELIREVGLNG